MKTQKIFRTGNSQTVVAIPKEIATQAGLFAGQKVVVSYEDDAVWVKKVKRLERERKIGSVSREFKKWLACVLDEDKEILDELSTR